MLKKSKIQGENWRASKTKRLGLDQSNPFQNPIGPGNYNVTTSQTGNNFNTRGTSCFISNTLKSTVLKDMGMNDGTLPGPGRYNPSPSFFAQKQSPGMVQMFGTISPRFLKEKCSFVPGPGKYGDLRQNYVLHFINQ